jgi:serine/threonine protein kinase
VDITNFGSTLQLLVDNPYKEIYRLRELQNTEFVPKLFDAFESSSNLYMATEWASGGSLAEACKNPLSPQQSQNYYRRILRICRVLEYFHICHADLKPANIVIHNGQVLFIDWGMSFKYKTGSSLARSLGNIRFGTSAYMSPERFFCRPLFVGQIDCWAASLCLFSMMTGLPCMYEEPHPENFLFFYIYHAALLSRNPDDSIIERVELGLTEKITMAMRRLDRLALKIWRDTQK